MRVALVLALLGCSSTVSGQPDTQPKAPATQAPASKAAPMSASQTNAATPDGFAKAQAAFVAHAAKTHGVEAGQLTVVPQLEPLIAVFKVASASEQISPRVNAAIGFQAAVTADRQTRTRGWALPDGTVITSKQNLGALLGAAGFGTEGGMPATELVRRIIWSFGPPHVFTYEAPEVDAKPDGSGTLRFRSQLVIPGGPKRFVQFVITRTTDGTATLTTDQ